MPKTDLHKEKKKSNLIIFGMIIGWCAIVFAVAIIKMQAWA